MRGGPYEEHLIEEYRRTQGRGRGGDAGGHWRRGMAGRGGQMGIGCRPHDLATLPGLAALCGHHRSER